MCLEGVKKSGKTLGQPVLDLISNSTISQSIIHLTATFGAVAVKEMLTNPQINQ